MVNFTNLLNRSSSSLDAGSSKLPNLVKDGETLVLTGVIQDTDIENVYKYPILGDLPLLGSLFRSTGSEKNKRELIILVTPKIINDDSYNIEDYNLEFTNEDSKNLLKQIDK